MRAEWSSDHRQAVEDLEEQLGREICGVPTEDGNPCSQWPVSRTHGRCRRHADSAGTGEDAFSIFGQPDASPKETDRRDPAPVDSGRSAGFWVSLALAGIVLGAGVVGGLLYYEVIWIPRSMAMETVTSAESETETTPEDVTVDIDPRNPDFGQVRSLYRQGEIDKVAVALRQIVDEGPRPARARAMYLQFVLYQNQEAYQQALDVADRFLRTFEDHDRHPEVLFGAAFLCKQYLDRPERAERYLQRLENQYPESAWAKRRSALS